MTMKIKKTVLVLKSYISTKGYDLSQGCASCFSRKDFVAHELDPKPVNHILVKLLKRKVLRSYD